MNDLESIQSQYEKLESQQKFCEKMLSDILTKKHKLIKKYFQGTK
jgi:hypothetical protein